MNENEQAPVAPIKTWRERIGVGADFPLHGATDVERAMQAEIAEVRTQYLHVLVLLQQVKDEEIGNWVARGFTLPTGLRAAIQAALEARCGQDMCAVMSHGRYCTRERGHDGPYAAHPAVGEHDHSEGGHHD